jgi:hypothetical protein
MNLICLGDVAIYKPGRDLVRWPRPVRGVPAGPSCVLFNWELPCSGTSVAQARSSGGVRLVTPRMSVELLRGWAPAVAALSNNHLMDAGPTAVKETIDALHSVSVDTVGGGEHANEPWIWSTDEATVGVLNWVTDETNPDPPDHSGIGPNYWPGDEVARMQISNLRQRVDYLVVFIHWSDELFHYPRPADRELARKLIDFGADAVIGHHSHVVRGYEEYRGKPIFYGLGNYYFGDFPSPDGGWLVKQARRNREALVVELKFRRGEPLSWQLHPFWQERLGTTPDPQGRAVKRAIKVSKVLSRSNYREWYEPNRRRFDRWEYRWHFRLPAMGVQGTFDWMLKTVRNSGLPK